MGKVRARQLLNRVCDAGAVCSEEKSEALDARATRALPSFFTSCSLRYQSWHRALNLAPPARNFAFFMLGRYVSSRR